MGRWGLALWAAAVAFSPGWATYAWTRPDTTALVRANAPGSVSLGAAGLHMLGSALCVVALWWWIARRDDASGIAALERAVERTRILVVLPIAVALFVDGTGFLGTRRALLIPVCAALVAWSVPPLKRRFILGGNRRSVLIVLGVATAATAGFLIRLAWLRHISLHTRAFDLGIYDNTVWNTLHGDFLGCSLIRSGVHTAAHFDPVLALIAPLYAIAPRAEALIVIQALWVLSAVVPVYLLAAHHLRERAAAGLVAACFLAYPSVHGVILYEFHSLTLLAPAALWLVYFLDTDRPRLYLGALALVLLVREDAALFAGGVGVYALLATPRRRLGLMTIGIAATYLLLVKTLVMPDSALLMEHSEAAYAYANRYRGLIPEGGGAGDAVGTLATNPPFIVSHLLVREKIMAVIAFVLPLGALPLLAGRRLLLCVYGTAFMFLASHKSLYFPLFHYASTLYPMLFAAVPAGIVAARKLLEQRGAASDVARRRVHAWLATCALLSTITMGAAVPNAPFALHTPIPRKLDAEAAETYAWLRTAIERIEAGASVSGTNRTAPHVTNRARAHILQQQVETDYLLIHDGDLGPPERRWLRTHADKYELLDKHGSLRLLEHRR